MSEALRSRGLRGYMDLVPWADPYIASLIEKVQMEGGKLLDRCQPSLQRAYVRSEAPPPQFEEFRPSSDEQWPRRRF